MPPPDKSKTSNSRELMLKAVQRRHTTDGKTRWWWYICAFSAEGKRASVGGWESARFRSYSKCVDAIHYINDIGGSYQAWQATQRKRN